MRGERLATRRGAARRHDLVRRRALVAAGRDIDELVHAADAAMYRAKQTGRDRTLLAGDAARRASRTQPELLLIAQSLAHTASIREGVPELHCAEVADLAGQIATQLDLPAATVLRCRLAGWLHDVGKITIPDRVLAKPGPLTDDGVARDGHARGVRSRARRAHARHRRERERRAPSPRALGRHRLSRPASRATRIPIEARVVAAADTWNAMTHDRVYRRALDFDAACAELREHRRLAARPAHRRRAARDRRATRAARQRRVAARGLSVAGATSRRAARRCGASLATTPSSSAAHVSVTAPAAANVCVVTSATGSSELEERSDVDLVAVGRRP